MSYKDFKSGQRVYSDRLGYGKVANECEDKVFILTDKGDADWEHKHYVKHYNYKLKRTNNEGKF